MVTFNTIDILRDLYRKGLAAKQLSAITADDNVIILQKKIDMAIEPLYHYAANSPQRQIEAIKSLITTVKDSPKRKEISDHITDIEARLVDLNFNYEKLTEQAQQLILHFWDTIVKVGLNNMSINKQELTMLYSRLETFNSNIALFNEKNKIAQEKVEHIIQATEKLTGQSFDWESLKTAEALPSTTVTTLGATVSPSVLTPPAA